MPQTYISAAPLLAGQSFSGVLPTANADGTGSRNFMVRWFRDVGALAPDGSAAVNIDAVITITQGSNTLLSVKNSDMREIYQGTGAAIFAPSPSGGAVTITNTGPGSVNSVSVVDVDDRG